MNFEFAMVAFKKGQKIRRKCWRDGYYYSMKTYPGSINVDNDDILADDWEVFNTIPL